jgi:hypothetical protein
MSNKILSLIFFLFLSSCGYEATHSKKNIKKYNFSIGKISFIGDRQVNLKIKQKLNNYTLGKTNKIFNLNISSTVKKVILAKDVAGDPTNFKTNLVINVQVLAGDTFRNKFTIKEKFNYDNTINKFNLKIYEREITNNLTEAAIDKIIFRLSNIQ